jgi:cell wall-associated NlpC family hydrolase
MRLDGWESRLMAVVAAAQGQPYVLGQNDCLRLACASVEALTGIDHWPRFVGYKTKRQARVTIAKIAHSLGEAVTATLGVSPKSTLCARRGDIVLFRDEQGEDHLGVCIGREVTLTAPDGVVTVGIDDPRLICSWRVG